MSALLDSLGGAGGGGGTTAGTVGDADLAATLSDLLGTEPSADLLAAFKADSQLMGLVNQYADKLATKARIDKAKEDAGKLPPPKLLPGSGVLGSGLLQQPNPAYTTWADDLAEAKKVLADYYEQGIPTLPEKAAYKTLLSQTESIRQRALSRVGQVQTAAGKTGVTATNPPDLKEIPTGKPGETQLSQYDPATGQWTPAIGPDGQPVPPKQGTPPQQPTPRVAEGTQSWELKELNGKWYQVPTRARADGSWEPDTSRMPQPAAGFPAEPGKVEVYDGVPYTRDDKGALTPVAGYVKPPMFRTDAQGRGYTSTDNGQTWKPASGLPGTPQTVTVNGTVYPLDENGLPLVDRGVRLPPGEQTQTVDGYLVRVDPATGQVQRTDLYTPEQRARLDETAGLNLETARTNLARAQQLADPVAEYQRQVQLSQQQATKYRDDLNQQVLEGRLSVEDASKQFDDWWGTNVEAKLSPYQTMAQASYRKEQNDYLQQQAAEQARVDAINRQREQVGYQAGEKARQDLMTLAPQGRSPEFLSQFAQNVSNIGQPLPGGPGQHGGGMRFSPESLSLDAVKRSQPSITQVGQEAVARALSQISPAAAQQVGVAPPQPPSLPQFQSFMQGAPFSIPNPALPVPGQEALDLGNPANAARLGLPVQPGYAGTRYQGGAVTPWQIPAA
jgi:hypothetical protein